MSRYRLYRITPVWCIILFMFIQIYDSSAQGCSDAGFCTMGAMRPNQNAPGSSAIKLRSFEVGQYLGRTQFKDYIIAYTADFNFSIGKKIGAQIKIPYMVVSGPLAKTNGFGDVSMSVSRALIQKKNWVLSTSVGIKFPLRVVEEPFKKDVNYSNILSQEGKPLPMYYQTSLGTFDVIWGASVRNKNWMLATGLQYSVNKNDNMFLWGPWRSSEDSLIALQYPRSKQLKRGFDVMLRVERNFRFSRFNFYTGLLPIWRLTPDMFTNPKGAREKAEGSTGLAMTVLLGAGYQFNVHHAIKLLFGKQVVKREHNPDGLSRIWVTSVNYEIKF
jgi:hypothetical protein